jgi:hypothetical protein
MADERIELVQAEPVQAPPLPHLRRSGMHGASGRRPQRSGLTIVRRNIVRKSTAMGSCCKRMERRTH